MENADAKFQEERSQDEQADKATKELLSQVTEQNKKIDESYDERMKRLDVKVKLQEDPDIERMKTIARLKEKYAELKTKISQARRSGKDPLIADLMLRSAPAKIKMADVTGAAQDIRAVEDVFTAVIRELDEALAQEEINIKKEIEQRLIAEKAAAKETAATVPSGHKA